MGARTHTLRLHRPSRPGRSRDAGSGTAAAPAKNTLTYELVCELFGTWFCHSTACDERGVDMRTTRWDAGPTGWGVRALASALVCWTLAAPPVRGASSRDYPGPCVGEVNAIGVPLYLAA